MYHLCQGQAFVSHTKPWRHSHTFAWVSDLFPQKAGRVVLGPMASCDVIVEAWREAQMALEPRGLWNRCSLSCSLWEACCPQLDECFSSSAPSSWMKMADYLLLLGARHPSTMAGITASICSLMWKMCAGLCALPSYMNFRHSDLLTHLGRSPRNGFC